MLGSECKGFGRANRSGWKWTALAIVLMGTSGCLFLSPDDERAGLRIEMIARADRADAEDLGKAVIDPATVLASDELTAQAKLYRTSPGVTSVELVRSVPLSVGPLVGGEREVSGLLEFNVGPVGSTYLLEAEILFLGLELAGTADQLDPAGEWNGEIAFEAGSLSVQVETLTLVDAGPANEFEGTIRLTHPSLNTQQIPSVPLSGVRFEPGTGRITMSYTAPELVQWDESTEALEVIQVSFDGSFAPIVAFRGEEPFDFVPTSDLMVINLAPVTPIEIGQRIVGTLLVSVHENDGSNGPGALILRESGGVTVARAQGSGR